MKKIIWRLSIVFFGMVLGLIVAEIGLRIFYPQQIVYSPSEFPYIFHCYQPLPYYWIGLKPNSSCNFRSSINAFPDFTVKTNSLGFRGPEINPQKPQDTKRILFIGDSFTVGLGVKQEDAFPQVIGTILDREATGGAKIETINAGVPASGPTYYYLLLKREIATIKPDIIVVGFYLFNDVSGVNYATWGDLDKNGLPDRSGYSIQFVDPMGNLLANALPLKFKIPYLRRLHTFAFLADAVNAGKSGGLAGPSGLPPELCLYTQLIQVCNFYVGTN